MGKRKCFIYKQTIYFNATAINALKGDLIYGPIHLQTFLIEVTYCPSPL